MANFKSSDITVVFQGAVTAYANETGPTIADYVKWTRKALPNATYILSTWAGAELPRGLRVDEVVYSDDPGGLPGIKLRDNRPNNANRQIVTSFAGLSKVQTPYAVKLRTDTHLKHAGFLDYYLKFAKFVDDDALVFCKLFTIDPLVFEQLSFHMSDWFQFGRTESLRSYWQAQLMSVEDASYYQTNRHAKHSTFLDKEFRCRLAVEQYVCTQFASARGYVVPSFHNDVSPQVRTSFQRFLQEKTIILDPWHIGLEFPKYGWAYTSRFQSFNCISHADWYRLKAATHAKAFNDKPLLKYAGQRARKKARMARLERMAAPLGPVLYTPRAKRVVNKVLARFL